MRVDDRERAPSDGAGRSEDGDAFLANTETAEIMSTLKTCRDLRVAVKPLRTM
jgi:hypothetical protein